jgi:hypothetical protein
MVEAYSEYVMASAKSEDTRRGTIHRSAWKGFLRSSHLTPGDGIMLIGGRGTGIYDTCRGYYSGRSSRLSVAPNGRPRVGVRYERGDSTMGRRRVISTASRRSPGPARAFLMTLAVGLLLGLLVGFFLGRIIGGSSGEQASPPVPPARTVMVEKTVRAPEKSAPASTATTTPSVSASASVSP